MPRAVVALLVAFLPAIAAFADPIAEAQELMRATNAKMSDLRSANPDAETVARAQQEAYENLERARALFEEGGISETTDAKAVFAYGDLLVRFQDLDLAAESLKRAHALEPDNATYAVAYGSVLVQLGEGHKADAAAALQSAIDLEPESNLAAEALAQLGELYRSSGLYEMALEAAEQALAITPDHAGALFIKAVCIARQGQFLEANTIMDDLSQRAPQVAADEHGRLYDAIRDFERRNNWVANTAAEHAAYGKMLIRVNRLPDSMDPLRHAARLNPDDAIVWNLLGSVYRQANRIAEAKDAFERSLAINPDQERTREVLQQLNAPAEAPSAQ